jgi:hypothetical protein
MFSWKSKNTLKIKEYPQGQRIPSSFCHSNKHINVIPNNSLKRKIILKVSGAKITHKNKLNEGHETPQQTTLIELIFDNWRRNKHGAVTKYNGWKGKGNLGTTWYYE